LSISATLKEMRISLAWLCFDASNCPCKAVSSGSRSYYQSSNRCNFPSLSVRYSIVWLDYLGNAVCSWYIVTFYLHGFVYLDPSFSSHDLPRIMLERRSDPMLRQALPLLYHQTSPLYPRYAHLRDLGKLDELISLIFRVYEESLDTSNSNEQLQIPCFVVLCLFFILRRLLQYSICAPYGAWAKLGELILLIFFSVDYQITYFKHVRCNF
jgi:hypothetical protein